MLLSTGFAALLVIVVLLYYLLPRQRVCPGCGAPVVDGTPLCSDCGWIHDDPDDDPDNEDDAEDGDDGMGDDVPDGSVEEGWRDI